MNRALFTTIVGAGTLGTVQAQLVGRANEIDRIDAAVHSVARGQGGFLCLVGEAGIGKTSLLHHAQLRLADLGVTVRTAHVAEPDRRRHLIVARHWYPAMAAEHLGPIDAVIANSNAMCAAADRSAR